MAIIDRKDLEGLFGEDGKIKLGEEEIVIKSCEHPAGAVVILMGPGDTKYKMEQLKAKGIKAEYANP